MNRLDAARAIAKMVTGEDSSWDVHLFARHGQSWVTLTFTDPDGTEHRMEMTRSAKAKQAVPSSVDRGKQCEARIEGRDWYCMKKELHDGPHVDYEDTEWTPDDLALPEPQHERPIVSPVKITRADGSVQEKPAYTLEEVTAIQEPQWVKQRRARQP